MRRRASGLGVEVPLAAVAGYVAQASARRAEQQVTTVEVEIPAEILRLGFEFIDTPGVGSAIEINTATTRRFLPQADAVVFVTGFDSPLTQAETGFLADAARHAGKLFLVLNKRDLVSGQDADAALEFLARRLREGLAVGAPRLFALSALEALEAVVAGDHRRLAGSGLPELHAELREFLATGKTRLFLRNIADRAARLICRAAARPATGPARPGRWSRPGGGADRLRRAHGRPGPPARHHTGTIAGRIETSLPGLLAARIPDWRSSLLELLGPCAEDALSEGAHDGAVRHLLEHARASLEEAAGRSPEAGWRGGRAKCSR